MDDNFTKLNKAEALFDEVLGDIERKFADIDESPTAAIHLLAATTKMMVIRAKIDSLADRLSEIVERPREVQQPHINPNNELS